MKDLTSTKDKQQTEPTQYKAIARDLVDAYNEHRPKGPKPLLCYAPFKSLRFSMSGNILACCYNRGYSLGHYPEDSINQTWFGEKANKLREHLQHNDLSLGCETCEKSILNQTYATTDAAYFDYTPEQINDNYPVRLEFELDNTCNLECVMCTGEYSSSIRKNRELRPAWSGQYDDGFVDQLEEFIPYLKQAYFTGGEPFLTDIYFKIWERLIAINPDINITVVTNGTILNSKIKGLLAKGKFHITISVDSLQKETYETVRLNGNLEQMRQNLVYFQDYCRDNDRWCEANFCVMRQNWKELPDFVNYCNDQNISMYLIKVIFPASSSLWNLESKQLSEILSYLSAYSFEANSNMQKENIRRYEAFVRLIDQWHNDAVEKESRSPITSGSIEEMKTEFHQQISTYVLSGPHDSTQEKEEKINAYYELGERMFTAIDNETGLRRALEYFNGLPVDRIIGEMEIQSAEALEERAKQAAIL